MTVREEARVARVPACHPLAGREGVRVEDIVDETFCGYDPAIDRRLAGLWTLDDHRGYPANLMTDRATNPQETLAAVATGRAITTVPAGDAATVLCLCDSIRMLAIEDARPALLTLVWARDRPSEIVSLLVRLASSQDLAAGNPGRSLRPHRGTPGASPP